MNYVRHLTYKTFGCGYSSTACFPTLDEIQIPLSKTLT